QFGFHGTPLRIAVKKKQSGDEEEEEVAKVRKVISPKLGIKPSKKTLADHRKKPSLGSRRRRLLPPRAPTRTTRKKKT
ncbi:MAG: hypothetical protein ACKN95_01215, partial [Holophagaceae bacterium]